jgi:simple sugar transport system permease protein
MMFVLIIATHVIIYFTRWGLRTRAIGENPHAADTLGVKVNRMRWINVTIGGLIAGLGGAWFSLEFIGTFEDNMIGGLGFIALAAAIFGKWTPFGAALGALLFGFSQALNVRFQIASVPIPPQFVQMIPYILTIVILAGVVGRAVAPKASGIPYRKE